MEEKIHGPHLVAAFFCDRALTEANGAMSFIRILDRVFVNGPNPEMQAMPFQATLVVLMKAGSMPAGKIMAKIQLQKPDGNEIELAQLPFLFDGGEDRGAGTISPFGFIADQEGLYWVDVSLEGRGLVTRIPIRFVYQRIGPIGPGPVGA